METSPVEDRAALVTGAAQGIGLGIARSLLRQGFRVALTDRDADAAGHAARELDPTSVRCRGFRLDVAQVHDWSRVVAEWERGHGRLDVLVNNAGVSPRGTAASTDETLWDDTLAVNLKGPWLGVRASLPLLSQRGGRIINIGSTHATIPLRNLFAYGVSKAGLLGLTRQVAVEYLHAGITCNMIAPGWVASPGERAIQAAAGRPDFPTGIHRMSSPDDVGAAVLYLVSAAARNVTGEVVHLDGGLHAFGDVRWVHFADAP